MPASIVVCLSRAEARRVELDVLVAVLEEVPEDEPLTVERRLERVEDPFRGEGILSKSTSACCCTRREEEPTR